MRHDQLPRFFFVYELVLDFVSKYITMVLDANIEELSAYYFFVTGSRFSKNVIILISVYILYIFRCIFARSKYVEV